MERVFSGGRHARAVSSSLRLGARLERDSLRSKDFIATFVTGADSAATLRCRGPRSEIFYGVTKPGRVRDRALELGSRFMNNSSSPGVVSASRWFALNFN